MSEGVFEKEYISRWTLNAKQHFDSGDYEWVCDFIHQCFPDGTCKRILELGCGAGYSTLVLLLRDYQVVSIDINHEAIAHTDTLIKAHDYSSEIKTTDEPGIIQADALLWQKDIVNEWGLVYALTRLQANDNPIDLIILCNPGGNVSREITPQEQELLKNGGFSKEEISYNIQNGCIDLLHKWALTYASCALSRSTGIPLLIVERETEKEINNTLEQISDDASMVIAMSSSRPIKNAPDGGTVLMNTLSATEQQYWKAGLFIPIDK